MSVRLKKRYSLLILVLSISLLSFLFTSKERIEISVISEFTNPDGEVGLEPGDDDELQIESCEGVEEPVSDVRYFLL